MAHSKTELLKKMSVNPWFATLPLAERKAMLAVAVVQPLAVGESVYRKGDVSGGFYGVLSGVFMSPLAVPPVPSPVTRWAA